MALRFHGLSTKSDLDKIPSRIWVSVRLGLAEFTRTIIDFVSLGSYRGDYLGT